MSPRAELWGYVLWVIGILLFTASSLRNRDWLSFAGSLFFLVGIVVLMIPMVHRHRHQD